MSNFKCEKCGVDIIDSDDGYITECEHYPLEKVKDNKNTKDILIEIYNLKKKDFIK